MTSRTSIVNISGDYEESLIQLARHLGKSKIRRTLFNAVYGRGSKPKSKKQLMARGGILDDGSNSQQAQNELDHLAKHHLVTKVQNDRQVGDGSRYLYGKDPSVRANRSKIVQFADVPSRTATVATKRNNSIKSTNAPKAGKRASPKRRKKLAVLYFTANPFPDVLKSEPDAAPLRVDVEVRRVQEAIRKSEFRDDVKIEYRPAADLQSIIDGLNDYRPQIIHFSGHSSVSEIAVDNQSLADPDFLDLTYKMLAKALAATDDPPKVLVLNSCHSINSLTEITGKVDVLIGMSAPISDLAAAAFAPQFYAALASGQSVLSAFNQANLVVETVALGEEDTIQISCANGVDPSTIKLI